MTDFQLFVKQKMEQVMRRMEEKIVYGPDFHELSPAEKEVRKLVVQIEDRLRNNPTSVIETIPTSDYQFSVLHW